MRKIILLLLIFLVFQCTTVGPKGKSALVVIPASQEITIGKSVDGGIKKEFKIYNDPEIQNYINNLGQKIASVSDRKELKYTFTVLQTNMINAFAAPGGFIYVTTGIMKFLDNEAQLAGVIGHEIGHVVGRHSVRALQKAYALQFGMQLALSSISGDQTAKLAAYAANVGGAVILQGYSRANEYDSDEMGTLYAYYSGYNPYEMAVFMGKLDALSGGKYPKGFQKLFTSHPPSAERKKKIEDLSATLPGASGKAINDKQFKALTAKLK